MEKAVVIWSALLLAGSAAAQDMQFGLEETAGQAPAVDAPPSPVLVRALEHYDHERFAQAAVLLQQVIEGATEDGQRARQQAQFFLAKALLHLGFLRSSLGLIDEITREGRGHPYFTQSLLWVGRLAEQLPDAEGVLDIVGRFTPEDLARTDMGWSGELRARLQLLLGEHAYREGELPRAVALLARVDPASSLYLRARFLSGVAQVRRRRAQPAIRAFRDVVRLVDAGQTHGAEEAERMRQLAWLSLGRVYYTAAHGARGRKGEGVLVGNAVHAWSQVESESEYWPDALFESAWALFVSDEHARALGNLHALLSPYFAGAFYPEAHLLQAVIYFNACQMRNAGAVIERFHTRYDALRSELRALLAREPDAAAWLALAQAAPAQSGAAQVSPLLADVLRRALSDRELRRALAELDGLAAEQQLLARASKELAQAPVGARIRQDLLVASALQQARADGLARARASRLLEELQEVANQADTVEIELLNYERGKLGAPPTVASAKGRSVEVDAEHVLWPFKGEYWRDELGYYRQEVTNHCEPR
jgi:hypothetical protein